MFHFYSLYSYLSSNRKRKVETVREIGMEGKY